MRLFPYLYGPLAAVALAISMAWGCGGSDGATTPAGRAGDDAGESGEGGRSGAGGSGTGGHAGTGPDLDASTEEDSGREDADIDLIDERMGMCQGDVVIRASAQLAMLRRCSTVAGSVTIDIWEGALVDLPILKSVTGNLSIHSDEMYRERRIRSVSMPMLASVGGDFDVSFTWISELVLPDLTSVQSFRSMNNQQLVTLDLPKLERIEMAGFIDTRYAMTTLNMPALRTVGADLFIGSPTNENPRAEHTLKALDLSSLASVSDSVQIANTGLETLSLPDLQSLGSLLIDGNDVLTELGFPTLDEVTGSIVITNNATLPQCAAQSLVDGLEGYSGEATLRNNADADAGACE